jgi:hypothetical protein
MPAYKWIAGWPSGVMPGWANQDEVIASPLGRYGRGDRRDAGLLGQDWAMPPNCLSAQIS